MLISKIRKSIELPAGDRRIAARMTLGFVAAILCLVLVLAGASMGLTGSLALSQPSPSGSPSPSGPVGEPGKIFLLNPNPTLDPAVTLAEPPREPSNPPTANPDPPKISDELDGVDEAYHIVAVVKDAPANALIEAYYEPSGQNEVTAGQMSPVPGTTDTFELYWNIDENTIPAGFGTLRVRLFVQTASGFEEVSNDEIPVRMQHETSSNALEGAPIPEAETVELLWPSQNGPLGFYKGAGAGTLYRTVVNGLVTIGDTQANRPVDQVRVFYSTTPIGNAPEYTPCATLSGGSLGGARPDGTKTFIGTCPLADKDLPSQVTAIAALAMQDQDPNPVVANRTQEGTDAHRVRPYIPSPADLKLTMESHSAGFYTGRRRGNPSSGDCITYKLKVLDQFDRPVQGANVDMHIRGPDDQILFGSELESGTAADRTSTHKNAELGGHTSEIAFDCFDETLESQYSQSDHNVPGANDTKHRESTLGSGLSGGGDTSFGEYRFGVFSFNRGLTDITAWIDDEELTSESEKRPPDDDVLEPGEVSDTNFAQWLSGAVGTAISVTIDPAGHTAAAGSCARYIVKVRDGNRAVPDANVDVHATGPNNDLDFCDPGDGSTRQAPNQGTGHTPEDGGEVTHAGQPPVAQHTEGVSNDQGNFIIGLTSPIPGDTTITAWYDGEERFDNDDLGSEPSGSATTNWVESTADAAISFLNPSPYGGAGTNVGRKQDVDSGYHLVARVSSLDPVAGVEFFYRSGSNPLVKIGDGNRVGETDAYEVFWPVDVADGAYTLVARIRDTNITVEQSVTVRNNASMVDPTVVPFETVEITVPLAGARATFANRRLTVRGVASSGAEGVNLFYTKASAITTPASGAWTSCGTSTLASASAPKEFTLDCTLAGPDQPGQVTGVAAIAFNCIQNCMANQTNHSGDAHRVFGIEANPALAMEPAETAADIGPCQKFVVTLTDQTGQPIAGTNLDVHLTGPGNSGNFCAPEDGTGTPRSAPDLGGHTADGNETDEAYHDEGGVRTHHTEGDTTSNGRLIFGIESETAGDAQLTVWLDDGDDDELGQGETSDVSIMHWEAASACDITGTDGPDELEGTDGGERICGFGGDDIIRGGGGEDVIVGGAGDDVLRGQLGDDQVFGGAGRDRVVGGAGRDRLGGGGGPDIIKGHRSNDRLRGNRGNDRLTGGRGRDDCSGGAGRDRLRSCETGTRSFAARTRPI